MRTPLKAGLLILLLVIPALAFLFLKNFGRNEYSLPRYIPQLDSTSGEILMKTSVVDGKEIMDTVFHTVPGFNLTDQHNTQVTGEIVKGKIHVADFFFARCPGICPKMSSQLQRVQEQFLNNPDVVILSYTVDPEHDSVEALQNYAQQYGAVKGKWSLLTGDRSQLYNLAKRGYFVTAKEGNLQSADIEENFVHTDKFILVDKEGHIRGFYNGTDPKDVDRLNLEIKILIDHYKTQ
ncbi:SCO family protein [Rhodocytophaga rosea]|uniref:SCO family protein n=1 Tax=Rhodocytophaga rosea TaxID=2704465 RepID=A0A6C0GFS4_9BACT|nr:SCO family protein [Rhodocytophaga rosea]QHT66602.1 SCO family protein [Rhodocytophaga rosea]